MVRAEVGVAGNLVAAHDQGLGGIDVGVAGQHDRITHPDASKYAAEHLPRGQFSLIARAGHAPFISHREAFLAQLRGFLDEVRR